MLHHSLLPLNPTPPSPGSWSAASTWLGILPHNSVPLQELLEPLRPALRAALRVALRAQVKLLLGQTIIAAQKRSWGISFDMIHQYLVRQKRVAKAVASGKRPPRWYPIFSRVLHSQSTWPPSQRATSYATSFISSVCGEDTTHLSRL
jgi:hypothetical protein